MAEIESLQRTFASSASQILTDSSSEEFNSLLARRTDLDKEMPYAIVRPAVEEDVLRTVIDPPQTFHW